MHQFFGYSPRHHYFEYQWYNLELLRLLGSSAYGGCDTAEFLQTVGQIRANDPDSWQQNWLALAERTRGYAKTMERCGHTELARGAFLRASNYFRCAQYLFPIHGKSAQPYNLMLYHQSINCFQTATTMMKHHVRRIEIPHVLDGVTIPMPGWLHFPAESQRLHNRKTPLLICIGGADSTQEELYFMSAAEGPELGYAVLTFDGPGQGLVLRQENVPLRPEGEETISSVLDFVNCAAEIADANIDLNGICVTGQSLGGYLALRAAADTRIKACAAIDPSNDMWSLAMARMPAWMFAPWDRGYIGDWVINWAASAHGNADIYTKYQFAAAQRMFGTDSPASTLREMKRYTFKMPGSSNGYLEKITCPVLVTGAAADKTSFLPEFSTDAIMAGLKSVDESQKELWVATTYADGGAQAKSGAWPLLQHRTFKFLDQKLEIERKTGS